MKNLINRSKLTFDKIEKLSLCQQISSYRQTLNMNQDSPSSSSSSSARISDGISKIFESCRSQLRRDDDNVVDDIMESIPFGFPSSFVPAVDTSAVNQSVDIQPIDEYGATYDDYGDVDFNAGNDYDFVNETMKEEEEEAKAVLSSTKDEDDDELLGGGMKLRWSVNDDDNNRNQQETDQLAASLDRQVQVKGINNKKQNENPLNDDTFTTFLNIDEISSSSNAWAGAAHWKYGNKRMAATVATQKNKSLLSKSQSQSIDDNETNSTVTEETNGKKGTKKATTTSAATVPRKRGTVGNTNILSFTKERIDDSKFGKINGKTDSTLLSKNALEKMKQDSSNLLLPDDEKVTVKDLCRLFLLPNYIVNPSRGKEGDGNTFFSQYFASLQEKKQKQSSSVSSFSKSKAELLMESLDGIEDKFFNGHFVSSTEKKTEAVMEDFDGNNNMIGGSCAASNDADYDDNYYEPPMADDMPFTRDEVTGAIAADGDGEDGSDQTVPIEGLKIDSSRFVQADRKVSKIEIK
jgi:hypothetical protein